MLNARNIFFGLFLFFFLVAFGGGLFWANLNFVQRVPGGAEFIVPWRAFQNFMLQQGVTPYGELTTLNIQTLIYGRAALEGEYPYRAGQPLFMLMLYLPFSLIRELLVARAAWMVVLEGGLLGVVYVSLRLARWQPHWLFLIVLYLFSVFWMPSVAMLVTATAIILQALVLFGGLRAIELGSDEFGGALAALCLLNVEATGLAFLALLIWIFSTQRWRVLGGIGMMLAVLGGFSFILMPSWLWPFFLATLSNWQSGALPSTYGLFEGWLPGIGQRLAQILAVGALALLLFEWRAMRGKDVRWLFWTACVSASLSPLLGIPYIPSWLVFTLPGVLLVVSVMVQRWGVLGLGSSVLVLLGIFSGLWSAQLNGLTAIFILVYPLVLTLLLYWVRWGAVRPVRMWADEIARRGMMR